jgi:hypothetical protein
MIYEHGASYFDKTAVGGILRLTESDLEFVPLDQSKSQSFVIPKDEIDRVECFKMYELIPNGFKLVLKTGNTRNFVVENHKQWMKRLNVYLSSPELVIA